MKTKLEKELVQLGLRGAEVRIYTYLLTHLEATAYEIGQELKMPRASVYNMTDHLIDKGFISSTKRNNVKYYSAESISRVQQYFDEQAARADALLPQLKDLAGSIAFQKPRTRMYLGKSGAQSVWEEILEDYKLLNIKTIYATTNMDLYDQHPKFFPAWVKKRRALGTSAFLLYPESQRELVTNLKKESLDNIKFLPNEFLEEGSVTVFGGKTAFLTFDKKQPITLIVESPDIARMMKGMLQGLWNIAGE